MDSVNEMRDEEQSEDEVVITSAVPATEINNNEVKDALEKTVLMDEEANEPDIEGNLKMKVVRIMCKDGIKTEDIDKIYSYIPENNKDDFRDYCDLISYTRSHVIARYDKTSVTMTNTKLLVVFEFSSFLCRFEFIPQNGFDRVILAQRIKNDTGDWVTQVYVSQEET